jgi:protein TonB
MSNPRIALYEFMPYGAPELLENSDRHLMRAMSAAMALFAALFAAALVLLPLVPRAAIEVPVPDPGRFWEHLPTAPRAPRLPHPPTPIAPAKGIPQPVPDTRTLLDTMRPTTGDASRNGTTGESATTGARGSTDQSSISPVVPDPGIFEYHEEYPSVATIVKPDYPDLARQAGVEGQVVVLALVGVDGHVKEVRLAKSVPLLDAAAMDAVRKWVFTPALDNHHPVPAWVRVPVIFHLH